MAFRHFCSFAEKCENGENPFLTENIQKCQKCLVFGLKWGQKGPFWRSKCLLLTLKTAKNGQKWPKNVKNGKKRDFCSFFWKKWKIVKKWKIKSRRFADVLESTFSNKITFLQKCHFCDQSAVRAMQFLRFFEKWQKSEKVMKRFCQKCSKWPKSPSFRPQMGSK